MERVAKVLTELGHKRIFAWPGASGRTDSTHRINALRASLNSRGIELPSNEELRAITESPRPMAETIRLLMSQNRPPTAIFCWHDRLGYEVLEACNEAGIRVPEQLSLVGYDGIHWPSISPHRLASVTLSTDETATTAVRLLDDLIHQHRQPPLAETIAVGFSPGTTLGTPASP
jgi:DNA-binding LacI/PurR family transcriptional regulator